jgi:hypothetical protein
LVGNNSKVFIERANVWHVFSKNLNLSVHPDVTYQANFTAFYGNSIARDHPDHASHLPDA